MCGLAGAISLSKTVGLFSDEVNKFEQLGIISQLRGPHSTGVMSVAKAVKDKNTPTRAVYMAKSLGNSSAFLNSEDGRKIVHRPDTMLLAMHCRFATVGDITQKNAHPFKCGKIYGMHNGTINHLAGKDTTDSENLLWLINEKGADAALREDVKGGAFALVYIDLAAQTLNIIRNVQRSLFYFESNQVMYFASEYEMLNLLRAREGMGYTNTIKAFDTDTFHTFNLMDLSDKKERKLYPSAVSMYGTYTPKTKDEEAEVLKPKAVGPPFYIEKPKVEDTAKGIYFAFRNKKLELNTALNHLNNGCTLCRKKGKLNAKAYWFNNYSWLCEVCVEDPVAASYLNREEIYEGNYAEFPDVKGTADSEGGGESATKH